MNGMACPAGVSALRERIDRHCRYLEKRGARRRFPSFYFHPWKCRPVPQDWISYGEGSVKPDLSAVGNRGDYPLAALDVLP